MRRVLVTVVMSGVVALWALVGTASAAPQTPASCKSILVTAGIGQQGAVAAARTPLRRLSAYRQASL